MADSYTLNWSGLVPFLDIDHISDNEFKGPGVYLWLWQSKPSDSGRVYYVGQASNLWSRQLEHCSNMMGGLYWVFDVPDSYADFWEFWAERGLNFPRHGGHDPEKGLFPPHPGDGINHRLERTCHARTNLQQTLFTWAPLQLGAASQGSGDQGKAQRRIVEAMLNVHVRAHFFDVTKGKINRGHSPVPGNSDKVKEPVELIHKGDATVCTILEEAKAAYAKHKGVLDV